MDRPHSPLPRQLETQRLTTDHNCGNADEVAQVAGRSSDPNPVRVNPRGGNVVRVAGSLAVTRALGDGYLKHADLSFRSCRCALPGCGNT